MLQCQVANIVLSTPEAQYCKVLKVLVSFASVFILIETFFFFFCLLAK